MKTELIRLFKKMLKTATGKDYAVHIYEIGEAKTYAENKKYKIWESAAEALGITIDKARSKCQSAVCVDARRLVIYTLRSEFFMTYKQIGAELGKDHTTIINALQKHSDLIETSERYRKIYDKFLKIFRS